MTWANHNPIQSMLEHYHEVSNEDDVLIPTTDDVAWTHFRDHRWVYNKMQICESQDIPYGPVGTPPTEYPVCVKPIYNLFGGSVKSQVCHNEEQYRQIIDPSLFWSPYHMGDHYSVDLIMSNGRVVEQFIFYGEKLQHGSFDYWSLIGDHEHAVEDPLRAARSWAEEFLDYYTGCVNIEVIGTSIIEVQLRMGDIDRLGCASLMESIHWLYKGDGWGWRKPSDFPTEFYMTALFAQPNVNFSINFNILDELCSNLTYWQVDKPELYHTNPSHGNRLAIFCGEDWFEVVRARNLAIALFSPDIDGRYVDCLTGFKELRY